jgi:hypothetical protein
VPWAPCLAKKANLSQFGRYPRPYWDVGSVVHFASAIYNTRVKSSGLKFWIKSNSLAMLESRAVRLSSMTGVGPDGGKFLWSFSGRKGLPTNP